MSSIFESIRNFLNLSYKYSKLDLIALFFFSLYIFFILYNPNFFDKNYYFLIGDFNFSLSLKDYFNSSLNGFVENANSGEGGIDQIRYTISIIIKFIMYFLNEYLYVELYSINRFLLILPMILLIYSIYDYTFFKLGNFYASIISAIYISGSIFLLQNVNIYIWLSLSGTIFFFKYLEIDLLNQNFKKIAYVTLGMLLIFSQLRAVIFLTYFTFFYSLYFLIKKKINIIFLIKYFSLLIVLIFITNFITFFNYYENFLTFQMTSESVNLISSRKDFIDQYNYNNINFFYVLRFIINTNNDNNNFVNSYNLIYFISYINFLIFFLSLFKIPKNQKYNFILAIFFLLFLGNYGSNPVKFILLNFPGLWTMSSPYHVFFVGLPFISLIFTSGTINLLCFFKKKVTRFILSIFISICFFLLNLPTNYNYLFINFFGNKVVLNQFYTNNFIKIDDQYFEIEKNINTKYKILHLPIVNNHYLVQDNESARRFPLILSYFSKLKVVSSDSYLFDLSKEKNNFFSAFKFDNYENLNKALLNENIKYIYINLNLYHKEHDIFHIIETNKLKLKLLKKNNNFILYEIDNKFKK